MNETRSKDPKSSTHIMGAIGRSHNQELFLAVVWYRISAGVSCTVVDSCADPGLTQTPATSAFFQGPKCLGYYDDLGMGFAMNPGGTFPERNLLLLPTPAV